MSATETSIHLQEIALEKAMAQSADEARGWHQTPLAKYVLAECCRVELVCDHMKGVLPADMEERAYQEALSAVNEACNALRNSLSILREDAITGASVGYDDEYSYLESLYKETPTVSEALAEMRREGRDEK